MDEIVTKHLRRGGNMSRWNLAVALVCVALLAVAAIGCSKKSKSSSALPDEAEPPTTTASPPGGSYGSSVNVTLTASEPGIICFTTDGSTPTTSHYTGSGPSPIVGILISSTTTLKFFAINNAGLQESVKTEEYVIAGGDNDPPVITSGPTVAGLSDSTATIEWTTDEPSDSEVEYGLDASYGQATNEAADETSHSVTLTGLSPDTTYHFRAGSTDPSGNGPTWSSDSTFTTNSSADSDPPVITSGPDAAGITDTAATISWITDEVSDSVVEYGLDDSYGQTASESADVTDHDVSLTGLSPDTTYHYRVGSTDPSGNGPTWSGDYTFTTVADTPDPLDIATTSLPGGIVGDAYSATLTATGGTTPYTWSITGSLPDGLGLNADTGEISGTPTASGVYNFVAEVSDSTEPPQTDSQELSILVAGSEVTVTLGTDTTARKYPLGSWDQYQRTQILYLKSEIESGGAGAGQITKLRFQKVSGDSWTFVNATIHLSHTSLSDLESDTWQAEGTLVFSGSLAVPLDNNWFEIELQTPFTYNNTENLLVSIRHEGIDTSLTGPEWCATWYMGEPDRCITGSSDLSNPPSVNSTARRPNVQIVVMVP